MLYLFQGPIPNHAGGRDEGDVLLGEAFQASRGRYGNKMSRNNATSVILSREWFCQFWTGAGIGMT